MSRRATACALAGLAASFAVTLWVHPWSDERITDLYVYSVAADAFSSGGLPYREVFFEYPPLAAPVLWLPALAGDDLDAYRTGFAAMALLLGVCVLLLVRALARSTGGDERLAMASVAVSPLLLGAAWRNHFDLAPVALSLAALVLVIRGRAVAGLAVLGLAGATKGYPLAMAPVVLAWLVARGDRRGALRGGLALTAIGLAAVAVPVAISPDGARDALRWQTDRPVQVESTPAAILNVTGADTEVVESHRSNGVTHPAAGEVAGAVAGLGLAVLVLLTAVAARRPDPRALVLAALAATAAFAAFGKVLSPQYLVWTVPLLALALAWRMRALAAVVAAATALTFFEFPFRYDALIAGDGLAVGAIALRDTLLVGAVALSLRLAYTRGAAGAGASASRARATTSAPASPGCQTAAPIAARGPSDSAEASSPAVRSMPAASSPQTSATRRPL